MFTFNHYLDSFYIDWTTFSLFFYFIFLFYFFILLHYTLYVICWRDWKYNYSRFQLTTNQYFCVVILWSLPILLLTSSWTAPEISIFSNHLILSNFSISFLTALPFALTITLLILFKSMGMANTVNNLQVFFFFLLHSLYAISFLLVLVTNLYSLIFLIEFLNLHVFVMLILTYNFSKIMVSNNKLSAIPTITLFFWVNTISSIFFFLLLLYSSWIGWLDLTLLQTTLMSLSRTTDQLTLTLVVLLFFSIFFFKLGLPPFVFWKLQIFNNVPVFFIFIYNVPYFLVLIFIYIFLLEQVLQTSTLLMLAIQFILVFLTAFTVIFAGLTLTLAHFFVISSALSVVFLTTVLNLTTYSNLQETPVSFILPLIYYFITYLLTLTLLILMLKPSSKFTSKLSFLTAFSGKFLKNKTEKKLTLLLIFISFAGLPPVTSFFFKIYLLTCVLTSSQQATSLFILFLFVLVFATVLFYFRLTRYFLVPFIYSTKKSTEFFFKEGLYLERSQDITHTKRSFLTTATAGVELTLKITISLGFILFSDLFVLNLLL